MKRNRTFPVIGITGGAGSGKTTVVEYMKKLAETEFLHCDVIAKELMKPGKESYLAVVKEFGTAILYEAEESKEGKEGCHEAAKGAAIDRAKLAKLAFSDESHQKRLNELTHPLVRIEVERRLDQLEDQDFRGVAVIEAALLLEAGYEDICDEIWYVHAPLADRKRRMRENRGYSEEKIAQILDRQLSEEEFFRRCDYTIENPDAETDLEQGNIKLQIINRLKYVECKNE